MTRRPGCAALPVSTGRLALLWAAVLVVTGCSEFVTAPETRGGPASCTALLALPPGWTSRLPRSLLHSASTACCNSVIKVASGRLFLCSFRRKFHGAQKGSTSSCLGLGFLVSTTTAARNRSKSDELGSSLLEFNHRLTASIETNASTDCSTLLDAFCLQQHVQPCSLPRSLRHWRSERTLAWRSPL